MEANRKSMKSQGPQRMGTAGAVIKSRSIIKQSLSWNVVNIVNCLPEWLLLLPQGHVCIQVSAPPHCVGIATSYALERTCD